MYKIIGADGKEYGPITAEQLRQWIAEGRANAQSQILAEGTTEWRPLSEFPEFAAPPPGYPGASPGYQVSTSGAAERVSAPAIGLIVVAAVGFLFQALGLAMNALGVTFGQMEGGQEAWMSLASGSLGIVSSIIGILISGLILFGALKMRKLESYGLAMASSIVAMIPCISPCCIIGLPIGIWALVVLTKPEVKGAFH
jgi:hypothetical protein